MATETAQHASSAETPSGAATAYGADGLPISSFEVVSSGPRAETGDLYSFRVSMESQAAEPAPKAQRQQSAPGFNLLLAVAVLTGLSLAVFLGLKLIQPKPPALYIDLGTQRFDPAGLGGRLIARWENGPSYQLSIDPLDQQQVAPFAAVAGDPPLPLYVTIRLRDSAGIVQCQKQILFPAAAPQANGADSGQALAPQISASADTVQNVAGEDGRIAEIDITGGLPCPLKAYRRLVAWDLSTNFPTLAAQEDWLRHENALAESRRPHSTRGNGLLAQAQHLPAPIEGDDVIVGDNPSKGTVETSGGRVFLVGASGLRNRSTEWQVFPAAIHFRCGKNGLCALTRANSRTALQARLLK